MKTFLTVVAVMFALLIAVGVGAYWFFSGGFHSETRSITVAHVAGGAIGVETANGAISVKRAKQAEVGIVAEIKAASEERLERCELVAERAVDGSLRVRLEWPGGKRKMREGCSFAIEVPPGIAGVTATSSNGNLEVEGLAGEGVLKTSNGSIEIRDHDGSARLETSNGRIKADGISGSLRADSSNGKIEITLADTSPGPVDLNTSNGSVELTAGSAFSGTLTLDTSNGSIDISDVDGARILKSGKKHAKIQIRDADIASSVETSNGSIKVKVRK